MKKILNSSIFIIIISIIQVLLIAKIKFWGATPNLSLIAIISIIPFFNFWKVLILGAVAGIIYGIFSFNFFPIFISLVLITSLSFYIKNKFFVEKSFLGLLSLVILATILFNLIFSIISYLFLNENIFNYFISWNHLIEILYNILFLTIISLFQMVFNE